VPSLVEKGYDNYADIFVEADKERIVQVLTNLLDNALKFIGPNGIISVTVRIQQNEKIWKLSLV
jgi:signal transduction histidine kinase